MDKQKIITLLQQYKNNEISEQHIFDFIKNFPYEDLSFAKIDHHRSLRWGFPEVIFCQGKTPEQVAMIAQTIVQNGSNLLATRATEEMYHLVREVIPGAQYSSAGRVITHRTTEPNPIPGTVYIITAGTSDLPVATEAMETATILGLSARLVTDIGVAGIHRFMSYRHELESASVIIVVAGMEGALPSVVAGMVSAPVIAVPTSIGYGASFNGITPLLAMLNSCVPGIAVMNIDNGFGASFLAFKMAHTFSMPRGEQHHA